jgi:hypothetical protein
MVRKGGVVGPPRIAGRPFLFGESNRLPGRAAHPWVWPFGKSNATAINFQPSDATAQNRRQPAGTSNQSPPPLHPTPANIQALQQGAVGDVLRQCLDRDPGLDVPDVRRLSTSLLNRMLRDALRVIFVTAVVTLLSTMTRPRASFLTYNPSTKILPPPVLV